jgi:hypothetical protein
VDSRGCNVLGFNNLWRLEMDKDGHATMTDHWILDLNMKATSHNDDDDGGGLWQGKA